MSNVSVLASSLNLRQPATISRPSHHGSATLPVGVSPSGLGDTAGLSIEQYARLHRPALVHRQSRRSSAHMLNAFPASSASSAGTSASLRSTDSLFSADESPRPALLRLTRMLRGRSKLWEIDHGYETAFRRTQADVVLAEYGTHGIRVLKACRRAAVPLVVHFHGADASRHKILSRYAADYRRMFAQAAAVIAVSRAMERQLLSLGCPSGKLIYLPCGVDCDTFVGARPLTAPPQFLGRGADG